MLNFIQTQLFFPILNMSLTGGVVILAVALARLVLRRAPKVWAYALWAVVLFRLLCPVSLSGAFSLLGAIRAPAVENAGGVGSVVTYVDPDRTLSSGEFAPPSGLDDPQILQPEDAEENIPILGPVTQNPQESSVTPELAVSLIWLAGTAAMAAYGAVSYFRLRRRLGEAVRLEQNLYLCDRIDTPFVLGLVRPRIYFPVSLRQAELPYILFHEQHHIRRGDPVWRMLAYIALCLHWFNPLVWLAFVLSGRDMEMSCDEAVLKKLGPHIREEYSQSLLNLSAGHTLISGTPLAFGEGDTKQRIHNLLHWRRPRVWLTAGAVALCLVVVTACAVNPSAANGQHTDDPDPVQSTGTELSGEPPLTQEDLERAVPDFLTPDQQLLYRRACNFYIHLFASATSEVEYSETVEDYPDPQDRESVDMGMYTYSISAGRYADYGDFDALRRSLFTDDYWDEKNQLGDGLPIFTEYQGKLCYVELGRGCGYYRNQAFPDTFELVSQTEEEIRFTVTGYYLEVWPPEGITVEAWQEYRQTHYTYTMEFPITLVNTPEGWRFSSFYETAADEDLTEEFPPEYVPLDDLPQPLSPEITYQPPAGTVAAELMQTDGPACALYVEEDTRLASQLYWEGEVYDLGDDALIPRLPCSDFVYCRDFDEDGEFEVCLMLSRREEGEPTSFTVLAMLEQTEQGLASTLFDTRSLLLDFSQNAQASYEPATRQLTLSYGGSSQTAVLFSGFFQGHEQLEDRVSRCYAYGYTYVYIGGTALTLRLEPALADETMAELDYFTDQESEHWTWDRSVGEVNFAVWYRDGGFVVSSPGYLIDETGGQPVFQE